MTMNREKGAATAHCACGRERAAVELPDGGVAAVPCTECQPAAQPEVATYIPRREFGSDVTDDEDETPEEVSEDDDE